MPRTSPAPVRQRSAGDLAAIPEGNQVDTRPQWLPTSKSDGHLLQLDKQQQQQQQQQQEEEPCLCRDDSAELHSFAEIPPERGLTRCRGWMRVAARKVRKTVLHRHTHDCTSMPAECREKLKHIYVY